MAVLSSFQNGYQAKWGDTN